MTRPIRVGAGMTDVPIGLQGVAGRAVTIQLENWGLLERDSNVLGIRARVRTRGRPRANRPWEDRHLDLHTTYAR